MDALLNELAFQKVLLNSIDDTVQNRDAAEEEVRGEIQALEKQIRDLRRGSTTASNSQPSRSSQSSQKQSSNPSKKTIPALANGTPSVPAMDGYLNGEQWHTISSTASTPNSADSMRDMLSPSRMNLPTRKRSHSKHLDGALLPIEDNKSRRTSPSPFLAGPSTPSTISSGYGPMLGEGYFDLTFDDEFEAFDREFLQQQKAAEERIKREKLDEEFARSFQQNLAPSYMNPPVPQTASAFDRISGVRPRLSNSTASQSQLGQSGARTLPWGTPSSRPMGAASVKSEPRSMTSGVKSEVPSGSYSGFASYASNNNNASSFKSEPSSSQPMPGSFREITVLDSDSDVEIIPASEYYDNGRHSRTPTKNRNLGSSSSIYGTQQTKVERPKFSPEAQIAGTAALRRLGQPASAEALRTAMFGTQQGPKPWMNSARPAPSPLNPFGSGVQSLVGPSGSASGYVYPSAYSNGMGGMNAMPGAYPGSTHISGPGLGYALNHIPDSMAGFGMNQAASFDFPSSPQGSSGDELDYLLRRPGTNFDDIADYLKLNGSMNGAMANQLDYIMNDPRKTNQEIKDLLENIRPDVDLPPEDREGTPEGLVYPLYEHQKLALTWLKSMEEGTNKGGILADDMGLGKTISALALILTRPSQDRARKTTLIVGPVALVRQWEKEIRTKIKVGHRLSTHLVHGQGKKLSWDDLRTFDVILTTYGTLAAEWKRLEKFREEMKKKYGGANYDEAPMRKKFPLLGPFSKFHRVILDEAQCIKNRITVSARACVQLKSTYRFCLTGTPMMNSVQELYSLIHFLRIKPYNEWSRFNEEFGLLTKGHAGKRDVGNAMRKLQAVLKAILLRRSKTSEIDGKPIITLPSKTEEIQHVVFDEDQQAFYTALESKTKIQFNRYMGANTVGKNYSNILVLLLRLRQACCHPHLIHDFEEAAPGGVEIDLDTMIELAKSLSPEVVARVIGAEGAFECPVCYDAAPNPRLIVPCGHDTCAECMTKIFDQAGQQNLADGNENGGASMCPTCRGALSAKKTIDYVTFKKVHMPDPVADDEVTASEGSDSDGSETDSEDESEDDVNENGDLDGFVVGDEVIDDETADEDDVVEGEEGDDEAEFAPRAKSKGKAKAKSKSKGKRRAKDKKGKKKETKTHVSIAMLKKEASRNAAARKRYMKYLRKNWQPSAKLTKCVELLENFIDDSQKTIIFSQFVSLLDLLQIPIEEKKWPVLRYDGAMSADARDAAIQKFTDTQTHNIMLISLKAGNSGLNLVAASRVIILDPFWNPYIEMQAVDRAYRIGQQREVQVHRILIQGTVEDRIIELQDQKRKLVDSALDEGANKSLGRLDVNQLAFLFGV
ncbi:hypothetical protein N431DRAFT_353892 [Stipitochalara longipes BDJ]|nr:hypothetical protein N431DRAFT_353892 [Stipitochalara longipes BDJ]